MIDNASRAAQVPPSTRRAQVRVACLFVSAMCTYLPRFDMLSGCLQAWSDRLLLTAGNSVEVAIANETEQ